MPVLSTVGAASLRAFGAFRPTSAAAQFIVATGGTVYVDPSNADYKIHQFTSSGTFTITASPISATIQLMMVGGGGAGFYGGGGAGGYIWRPSFSVSAGSYAVTIGTGGPGVGSDGTDTTFGGLVALGGGGGNDRSGGSGGGGVDNPGGAGLQPTSVYGGFGNKGGDWTQFGNDGGGGGAGSAGTIPNGGSGRTADIISSAGTYATFASGGYGNVASISYALPAVVANSGNGGWGGGYQGVSFGLGQDGIVRIRYKFQ